MSTIGTNIHHHLINIERAAGLTDEQIADKLGQPLALVRAAPVPRPNPQRERAVQHMQLQTLQTVFLPKAAAGDAEAAGLVLKLQRRQADLLGLDAPKQTLNMTYEASNLQGIPTHVLKQMLADQAGLTIEGESSPEPTEPTDDSAR
jgi:hypothetical protein